MSTYTLHNTHTDLKVLTCYRCGVLHAIPRHMQESAQEAGNFEIQWYCPNGHKQGYGESDAEKERARRLRAEASRARAEDRAEVAERSARAYKGQATKARKRIGKGVCPCCNRHFSNVERHMATQHPDFAGEAPGPDDPPAGPSCSTCGFVAANAHGLAVHRGRAHGGARS